MRDLTGCFCYTFDMKKKPFNPSAMPDLNRLDAAQLRSLLEQMTEVFEAQEHRINQQAKGLQAAEKRILLLEEIIRLRRAQKFAASSEKSTFQLGLFDEAELEAALGAAITKLPEEPDESPELKALRKERKTRNRALPAGLPRTRIELLLSEVEK